MLTVMAMMVTLFTMTNPILISMSILMISLMVTPPVYKSMPESWIAFVMVITFSTGMMILFLYASSLTSNEINKFKKTKMTMLLMATAAMTQKSQSSATKSQSEAFSTKSVMMMTATILLMTMLALSIQGYAPNQSMNSSF